VIARRRPMHHPAVSQLAQIAGNDLPRLQAWSIQRHLRRCNGCAVYVDGIRSACEELRREAESRTLTAYEAIADMADVEREMAGNIRVGLAAARCVETIETRHPGRKLAWLATGLSIVFIAGWWTHVPSDETRGLIDRLERWAQGVAPANRAPGTVMHSLPGGIAVRSQGLTLTMRHPRSAIVSVAGSGVMEARFVDDDTGQVTISSVYGQ
jgi:hypothetical protein